jgi:tetratricopeptide (TPR) repeat protein
VLILTLVLGGGSGACSSSHGPGANAATLIGAASAAFRQRDYNAASQLFQQAIKKDPSNATAYYDLGSVYQAQNLDQQAITSYRKALSLAPTLVPAIFNEATIYAAHDAPLAIFLYRRAIALQPDSPTAYLNLGLLEAQTDAAEQAQAGADLRKAIQLDPSLRARIPQSVLPDLSLPPPVHHQTAPTTPGGP